MQKAINAGSADVTRFQSFVKDAPQLYTPSWILDEKSLAERQECSFGPMHAVFELRCWFGVTIKPTVDIISANSITGLKSI